jgi:hypothetical protein
VRSSYSFRPRSLALFLLAFFAATDLPGLTGWGRRSRSRVHGGHLAPGPVDE